MEQKLQYYFLKKEPIIKDIAEIDTIQFMVRTIVYPDDWIEIAKFIADSYHKYDGFIITMRTDTLAYTTSMLSFMLDSLSKPITITGAMFPIDQDGSDAIKNLTDSVLFACSNYVGVYVIFNGKVIKGCRASKVRSNSISAFESINTPRFGEIKNGKLICKSIPEKITAELKLDTKMNTNIITIRLNPQTSSNLFETLSK